jgi:hypothetical protein
MQQLDKDAVLAKIDGFGLAVNGGHQEQEIETALRRAGVRGFQRWALVTEESAGSRPGSLPFKKVLRVPSGPKNAEQVLARVSEVVPGRLGVIVAVINEKAPPGQIWDTVYFCANAPARARYVIAGETLYSLAEYCNMNCKATEQEWTDSDFQAVACTLYGYVSETHSGLHSLFLGKQAYERFLDSYYLEDLLGIRYYQRAPEKFYYMLYLALLYFRRAKGRLDLTELGATLWSTIDKIEYCHRRLRLDLNLGEVEWVSIELSDYFRRLSELLHPNCDLTFYDRWERFLRRDCAVAFSHLVTPYAFHDEDSVTSWLQRFGFCLWVNDFTLDATRHLRVNGKRWTLLPLRSMLTRLRNAGMEICYIDARDLDPEGQIKRTALVIYQKKRVVMDDYLRLVSDAGKESPVSPSDLRPFRFDPGDLWQKVIDDPSYFESCAERFSAGFAGASGIGPTEPYELKWGSAAGKSKLDEYLRQYAGAPVRPDNL